MVLSSLPNNVENSLLPTLLVYNHIATRIMHPAALPILTVKSIGTIVCLSFSTTIDNKLIARNPLIGYTSSRGWKSLAYHDTAASGQKIKQVHLLLASI